jgi:hypothetical protein
MEKRLSQQIQEVIDLLQRAGEQADHVKQTLSAELEALGLSFDQLDEEISRVLDYLRGMKAKIERYEDDDAGAHGGDSSLID